MRIALVSTGLGHVLRGFESFTESLFQALRRHVPALDVTLFQGGGKSEGTRRVVPHFRRGGVPARWLGDFDANLLEQRSFALGLFPELRLGRFDVVHYNELVLGSALFHLRRYLGGEFKLVYCNGAPSPPVHYHLRCDFAQLLTGPQVEEAMSFGFPVERTFAIPYGLDSDRFSPSTKKKRMAVRASMGIPDGVPMVLSVAAIKREHKRIDYLISETARLKDAWLVVAGQRTDDTPYLQNMAERLLPGRWRFVSLPHERVAELYGAADVFALCSLTEAFGLVTIEAVLSELPVIINDGPVFRWLAQDLAAQRIDMSQRGNLTAAMRNVFESGRSIADTAQELKHSREVARKRFGWEALVYQYVDMYRNAVGEPRPSTGSGNAAI